MNILFSEVSLRAIRGGIGGILAAAWRQDVTDT